VKLINKRAHSFVLPALMKLFGLIAFNFFHGLFKKEEYCSKHRSSSRSNAFQGLVLSIVSEKLQFGGCTFHLHSYLTMGFQVICYISTNGGGTDENEEIDHHSRTSRI